MKRCICLVFLFWGMIAYTQEICLPIVKQGKWYLLKNGKEKALPPSYSYVDIFDEKGFAYFQEGQQYGILNESGEEIVAARYKDIISFGKGFFSCKTDSLYAFFSIHSNSFRTISCLHVKSLSPSWIYLEDQQNGQYINLVSESFIPDDTSKSYQVIFDHLYLSDTSDQCVLYSRSGQKLYAGQGFCDFSYNEAYLLADSFNLVFNDSLEYLLPQGATDIAIRGDYFTFKQGKLSHVFDLISGKIVFTYPCDRIYRLEKFYEFSIRDKTGLLSFDKKVLIPPAFDFFEYDENYIYPSFNTLTGIYTYGFQEIIPCKYKNITFDKSFFHTMSTNGYVGLVSRKTQREILPAVYDNIEIKDLKIKARYNGTLTFVTIDSQHRVKDKFVLDNTISLRSNSRKESKPINLDPRLLALGWYCDTLSGKGKDLLWGLKNQNDSILVKAKFKNLKYVKNAPFSLERETKMLNKGSELYEIYQSSQITLYTLLDYTNAKKLPLKMLISLDTLDFISRDYARFLDTESFGIVRGDNKVERFSYIDLGDFSREEPIRYCNALDYNYSMTESPVSIKPYGYSFSGKNKKYLYINYEKASWNFLKSNGDSLFKEPFSFVQPYIKQTSIVSRNNAWGVVFGDSVTIPLKYNAVTRLKQFADTTFLVAINHKNEIFLDSTLTLIDTLNMKFEKENSAFYVLKNKNTFYIFAKKGGLVLQTEKTVKFHDFKLFVIKEKKDFLVYNEKGNVIGELKNKPEQFLSETEFIAESANKKGVLSIYGDTLIPFKYAEIEPFAGYILARSSTETLLFDKSGKLLVSPKNARLLLDQLNGNYALVKESKIEVFDPSGKRISKFSTNGIELHVFHNGRFFSDKQKNAIYDLSGKPVNIPVKITDRIFLADGYSAFQDNDKFWRVYDQSWKELRLPFSEIRKVSYLGEGIFTFRTKGGFMLYNDREHVSSALYKQVTANHEYGLLLAERNNGKFPFEFIDRNFENTMNRRFSNASIFEYGLAPVADERGWTLFDLQGFQKSYPNFNKLRAIDENLYQANDKTYYGITDRNGNVIIEAVYEKINILNRNIIQAIRQGTIAYFDYSGKRIY